MMMFNKFWRKKQVGQRMKFLAHLRSCTKMNKSYKSRSVQKSVNKWLVVKLFIVTFALLSSLIFLGKGTITSAAIQSGNVDTCGTINVPGIYVLTTNVDAPNNCFEIESSDVFLDCQGN